MDNTDLLAFLRRDADALLDAARATEPTARVEGCPDYDVVDLVWHIGEVHRFWATIVKDHLSHWREYERPERPGTPDGVFDFAAASAQMVVEVLSAVDPEETVWTWTDRTDAGWVIRRMAQETAVHRFDAERAAGRPFRIDAELAADGLDEFLRYFLPDVVAEAPPLEGSVHVHCEDTAGEWVVRADEDGAYQVTNEHAKGDAAMRGPAHDLLMVLWRRAPLATVDVVGDLAVAERFVARTELN